MDTYFIYPLIKRLQSCSDPAEAAHIKALIAVNVGNPRTLLSIIGSSSVDFMKFGAEKTVKKTMSAEDSIDSFISKYGGGGELQTADSLLLTPQPEKTQPDAAVETVQPEQESKPKEPEEAKEAAKVKEHEKPKQIRKETPKSIKTRKAKIPTAQNNDSDIEKVKSALKNHDFEEALSIMNQLNLNNPKKSIYFADQIRFIKKMMENEEKKKNAKH